MSKELLINMREYILKNLSYEEKMWLISELEDLDKEEELMCPYTKAELNARIDQAEREIANGECTPSDEFFRELDQEFNLGLYQYHQAV
ncbi:MAG: hypothetical protein IKQ70_02020 [Bacteroidales bacterium]|nr:hypothetical protein [Bacteroidales bacterium]